MSTELATTQSGSALVLQSDQDRWNDQQTAALRQMGLEEAGDGDLAVFFHVSQRTGLDPFARQIYMIGRKGSERINGQWVDVMKYTIQTGIDGFRVVGRRAADAAGDELEYEDTLWCGPDREWVDAWIDPKNPPMAARVVVLRNGKRFPATASYGEYAQFKRDGSPNSMWAKMPANQLAKCAEALALRKAYPQDFAGLYADEEMGQADNTATPAPRRQGGLGGALATQRGKAAPESPLLDMTSDLAKRMFATLNDAGITDRDDRLAFVGKVTGRDMASSSDMTDAEASAVIAAVEDILEQPAPAGADDIHEADIVEDGAES